jgi:hypothetical protein
MILVDLVLCQGEVWGKPGAREKRGGQNSSEGFRRAPKVKMLCLSLLPLAGLSSKPWATAQKFANFY